jgi:hypothetical protein
MRNRLLSHFCRHYGLKYLHRILSPLLTLMSADPDQSYDIAPGSKPPHETSRNIAYVQALVQATLDVIIRSLPLVPP